MPMARKGFFVILLTTFSAGSHFCLAHFSVFFYLQKQNIVTVKWIKKDTHRCELLMNPFLRTPISKRTTYFIYLFRTICTIKCDVRCKFMCLFNCRRFRWLISRRSMNISRTKSIFIEMNAQTKNWNKTNQEKSFFFLRHNFFFVLL